MKKVLFVVGLFGVVLVSGCATLPSSQTVLEAAQKCVNEGTSPLFYYNESSFTRQMSLTCISKDK